MGHEIVYCYWCSSRILGADFDKGAAVQIGNHACCPQCLPKVMASLPDKQRETLLSELSKPAAPRPSRVTPRSGSPMPASPERTKPPMLLFAIGGGVLVLAILLILVMNSGKTEKSDVRNEPPPLPVPKPVGNDREKAARDSVQKARDAARSGIDIDLQVRLWEEAVAKSERTAVYDEATQERSAILIRRKEVYAQEFTRLVDSVDGILRDDEFKKALDALVSARKRHDSSEWSAGIERKIDEVKKLEAGGIPYRQGADDDGLICVEAERFHRKTDLGEHAWTLVTAPAPFSGTGAMAALPNKGSGWPSSFADTSPRLDYRIHFVKAGKYFLWVRGWAATGNDDSVHFGLDGKESKVTGTTFGAQNKWNWSNRTMASVASTLDVPSPGLHSLTLWMREDGAIVDKVILTLNPKYVPKDLGPPETSR